MCACPVSTPEQSSDDLTAIQGIGPHIARRLVKAGIDTYTKLATATKDDLTQAIKRKVTGMDAWITQARKLADVE